MQVSGEWRPEGARDLRVAKSKLRGEMGVVEGRLTKSNDD